MSKISISLISSPLSNGRIGLKADRNSSPEHARLRRSSRTRASAKPSVRASAGSDDEDSDKVYDTIIVGAGVSGLSTAFTMTRGETRPEILVTEVRDRVGGNVTSRRDGAYVWEEGPNSYQPSDAVLKLAYDAGMGDQILLANPDSDRYVLWDNELKALPKDIPTAIKGDFLTWPGKIRAGLGAIGLRMPKEEGKEETVKEFVTRNLGDEAFQRLIEPFCSGVYAGDPAMLSAEAATGRVSILETKGPWPGLFPGALVAQMEGAKKKKANPRDPRLPIIEGQTVGSFKGGLNMLPKGLAEQLGSDVVKLQWKLIKTEKTSDGKFQLTYETPEGEKKIKAKSVVFTQPAYVVADTVRDIAPKAAKAFEQFYYPPVASVTVAYKRDAFKLDGRSALPEGGLTGFGQLHPRTQKVRTLGTIYSSYLWSDDQRCPKDEFMILNYIGGARDVEIKNLSEDELVEAVHKDALKTILKPNTPIPKKVGVRIWQKAIPQFNVGHWKLLDRAKSLLTEEKCAQDDGLFLGGNYVAGVAFGRCVEFGCDQAADVLAFLNKQKQPR